MNNNDGQRARGVSIDLKVGESLTFDMTPALATFLHPSVDITKITLTLEAKHGQRARVRVQADEAVKVSRPERKAAKAV